MSPGCGRPKVRSLRSGLHAGAVPVPLHEAAQPGDEMGRRSHRSRPDRVLRPARAQRPPAHRPSARPRIALQEIERRQQLATLGHPPVRRARSGLACPLLGPQCGRQFATGTEHGGGPVELAQFHRVVVDDRHVLLVIGRHRCVVGPGEYLMVAEPRNRPPFGVVVPIGRSHVRELRQVVFRVLYATVAPDLLGLLLVRLLRRSLH